MTVPFREELEGLRDGGPVDDETLRRVALAALRWVPAEELVQAIGRRWQLRRQLLVLLDPNFGVVGQLLDGSRSGLVEDLTPDDGWQR